MVGHIAIYKTKNTLVDREYMYADKLQRLNIWFIKLLLKHFLDKNYI